MVDLDIFDSIRKLVFNIKKIRLLTFKDVLLKSRFSLLLLSFYPLYKHMELYSPKEFKLI